MSARTSSPAAVQGDCASLLTVHRAAKWCGRPQAATGRNSRVVIGKAPALGQPGSTLCSPEASHHLPPVRSLGSASIRNSHELLPAKCSLSSSKCRPRGPWHQHRKGQGAMSHCRKAAFAGGGDRPQSPLLKQGCLRGGVGLGGQGSGAGQREQRVAGSRQEEMVWQDRTRQSVNSKRTLSMGRGAIFPIKRKFFSNSPWMYISK